MSGSVELKINGRLIGNVYYHNAGYLYSSLEGYADNVCEYSYEYHSWPEGDTVKGKLTHARHEGVEKLVHLIF